MKFGVQLYGPLNNMQGEVLEKLAALAKAGITEIEPCMTDGANPRPGGRDLARRLAACTYRRNSGYGPADCINPCFCGEFGTVYG